MKIKMILWGFALVPTMVLGGVKEMKAAFEANPPKVLESTLLTYTGVKPGWDVYSCSIPFEWKGAKYMFGRVEPRAKWASSVTMLFRETKKDHWERVLEFGTLEIEDPSICFIKGELVLAGTRVTKVNGHVTDYAYAFYRDHGKGPFELEYFTTPAPHQKDVRLVELKDGRIGVFTRPQGGACGRGRIGFTVINGLDELRPDKLANAKVIDGLVSGNEWCGANMAYLRLDGKILAAIHLSFNEKVNGVNRAVYTSATFVLDPQTRKASDLRLFATRSLFPPCEAKTPGLVDCAFLSGIVFNADGTADVYSDVANTQEGRIRILLRKD